MMVFFRWIFMFGVVVIVVMMVSGNVEVNNV